MCEMDQEDLRPQMEYPGPHCPLSLDLNPTAAPDPQPGPNSQASNQAPSSNLDAADAGQFGRTAQAVSLLDRLLSVICLPTSNKETKTKLAELAELDSEVRTFLEVVMGELEWRQTPRGSCVSVALCVR